MYIPSVEETEIILINWLELKHKSGEILPKDDVANFDTIGCKSPYNVVNFSLKISLRFPSIYCVFNLINFAPNSVKACKAKQKTIKWCKHPIIL